MSDLKLKGKRNLIYDIEVFAEDYCFVFKDVDTNQMLIIDSRKPDELDDLGDLLLNLDNTVLIGWNSSKYDDLIFAELLIYILNNKNDDLPHPSRLKLFNDNIIVDKSLTPYNSSAFKTMYKRWAFSIDLMNIDRYFVSGQALKEVAAKLDFHNVQESPIGFDQTDLTDDEWQSVVDYCINDVNATHHVYSHPDMMPNLETRELIANDFKRINRKAYVLGSAALAEKVLLERMFDGNYKEISKIKKSKPALYTFDTVNDLHPNIRFHTDENQEVLERFKSQGVIEIADGEGLNKANVRKLFRDYKFNIAQSDYVLGVGGLHTKVKPVYIEGSLIDYDVTSYYPTLMTTQHLIPEGMDDRFVNELKAMTEERIVFKKAGESVKASALKLVINSLYGKTGSKYSPLYDPKVLMKTTVNGQLMLMMLIELFEMAGNKVIAGNTDGVLIQGDDCDDNDKIIDYISELFDINFEKVGYDIGVIRDVNNYVLRYANSNVFKRKGVFGGTDMPVIYDAVVEYFVNKTPIEDSIVECIELSKFNTVSKSKAHAKNRKIIDGIVETQAQKIHRFYRAKDGVDLLQGVNTTKSIRLSDKKPENLPSDVDYNFYIQKAILQKNDIELSFVADEEKYNKASLKLKNLGLAVAPKGSYNRGKHKYEKNPVELGWNQSDTVKFWQDNTLSVDNSLNAHGFGFYTGSITKVISFDIDNIELAKESGFYDVIPKSKGLMSWHGDYTKQDVVNGVCGGTISFLYEHTHADDILGIPKLGFLRDSNKGCGVETFYDTKDGKSATIIQCHGKWQKATIEDYKFAGKLTALPEKLKTWALQQEEGHNQPESVIYTPLEDYVNTSYRCINDLQLDAQAIREMCEGWEKIYSWNKDIVLGEYFGWDRWNILCWAIGSILGPTLSIPLCHEVFPHPDGINRYHIMLSDVLPEPDNGKLFGYIGKVMNCQVNARYNAFGDMILLEGFQYD